MSTVASTNAFDKNPQSKERGITLDLGRALLLCSTCILMCLHVALFFIILARKRRLSQTVETFSVHGRLDLRFSHLLLEASDLPFSWLIFCSVGTFTRITRHARRLLVFYDGRACSPSIRRSHRLADNVGGLPWACFADPYHHRRYVVRMCVCACGGGDHHRQFYGSGGATHPIGLTLLLMLARSGALVLWCCDQVRRSSISCCWSST